MPSSPLRFSSSLSDSSVSFLMAARCISSALICSISRGLNRSSSASSPFSISTPAWARISSMRFCASSTWAATCWTCCCSACAASFFASRPVRSCAGSHHTARSAAHAATGHHELAGASIGTASRTTTRRALWPASSTTARDHALPSCSTHSAVESVSRRPARSSTVRATSISLGRRTHATIRAASTATPAVAGSATPQSMVTTGTTFCTARTSTASAMAQVSSTTAWRIQPASSILLPARAMTSRIGSMPQPPVGFRPPQTSLP